MGSKISVISLGGKRMTFLEQDLVDPRIPLLNQRFALRRESLALRGF